MRDTLRAVLPLLASGLLYREINNGITALSILCIVNKVDVGAR